MDLVRSTKEALQRLAAEEKPQPKTEEDLSRNLAQMKIVLQGTPGKAAPLGDAHAHADIQ